MNRFLEAAQARAEAMHEERLSTTRGAELERPDAGEMAALGGATSAVFHTKRRQDVRRRVAEVVAREPQLLPSIIAQRLGVSVSSVRVALKMLKRGWPP